MVLQSQESPKTEVEIATLVFGVLLVMISILTTMPNDVLDLLKRMVVWSETEYGTTTVPAVNTISILILLSLLSLLVTIPLYLLYLGNGKASVLICARTFLILGFSFITPLLIIFSGLFMYRLMGKEATEALINPTLAMVTGTASLVAVVWISMLWYRGRAYWKPFLKRHLHRRSKDDDCSKLEQ